MNADKVCCIFLTLCLMLCSRCRQTWEVLALKEMKAEKSPGSSCVVPLVLIAARREEYSTAQR